MNTAIIVAAGSGTRFGSKIPKQFTEICGKPMLIHTLERFQACAIIDEIILVLSATEAAGFLELSTKYRLTKISKIVTGGKTRAESVSRGLKAVRAATADIIAVHDGARPLVSVGEITDCVKQAKATGAAILVAAVTDTIKQVTESGTIEKTVARATLRRALTPQCFRYAVLKSAFDAADLSEAATDESYLVEQSGVVVSAVEGSSHNIKITHQEDLIFAEALLKNV